MFAAANLALHQSRGFKHPDMTRYASECHRQWGGQVGDARVALAQCFQEPAAGRVGECAVGPIQHLIFNHFVDYSPGPVVC